MVLFMRKQGLTRLIGMLLVLAQLFSLCCAVPVFAADDAQDEKKKVEILPYACSNCAPQTEEIELGGTAYSDAVLFTMGYNGLGNGATAQATYYFDSDYGFQSMSFTAGFVRGWDRDATITIIADGVTVYDEVVLSHTGTTKKFSVSLSGVQVLKIIMHSDGYDKVNYAIGGISYSRSNDNEQIVYPSDEFYDIPRDSFINSAEVLTGPFTMGGLSYENGYIFSMGYGWTVKYSASVTFAFKEQYEQLYFDIGKYFNRVNESYLRSAYLTIEADGVTVPGYDKLEMKWDDPYLPVTVNLNGVNQLTITVNSDGYDTVKWAMGDIQLISDGKPHGVAFDGTLDRKDFSYTVKLTKEEPNKFLNPRIYPSDATGTVELEIDKHIIAMLTDDFYALGRSGGNAVVTAKVKGTDVESICYLKSSLPAAKFIPSEDGWGFKNEELDLIELEKMGLMSGYYDDLYRRICGNANSYLKCDSWEEALDNVKNNPTFVGSPFRDIMDALWYSLTGSSSLGGLCHGFSVSTALTYTNGLPFSTWDFVQDKTYSMPYDIKKLDDYTGYSEDLELYLKQMIFACHLTQGTVDYHKQMKEHKNDYEGLLKAVRNFRATGKNPVVMRVVGKLGGGGHAVLPYDVLELSPNKLLLFFYNPNTPGGKNHPDQRYLYMYLDDDGKVVSWDWPDNYNSELDDLSYFTDFGVYADRIKKTTHFDILDELVITAAKHFAVKKNNETLLSYENGAFIDDTDQVEVVPFILSAGLTDDTLTNGVAVAVLGDGEYTIEIYDSGKVSTGYYDEDSAYIVEADGIHDIIIGGASEDGESVTVKAEESSDVSIRRNDADDSVIVDGSASSEITVTYRKDDDSTSFTGFTEMKATTIVDGEENEGEKQQTDAAGIYVVDSEANITRTYCDSEHIWEQGICTVCGAADPDYAAPVPESQLTFRVLAGYGSADAFAMKGTEINEWVCGIGGSISGYFEFNDETEEITLGYENVIDRSLVSDNNDVFYVAFNADEEVVLKTKGVGTANVVYTHTDGSVYKFPVNVRLNPLDRYTEAEATEDALIDPTKIEFVVEDGSYSFYVAALEGWHIDKVSVDDIMTESDRNLPVANVALNPDKTAAKVEINNIVDPDCSYITLNYEGVNAEGERFVWAHHMDLYLKNCKDGHVEVLDEGYPATCTEPGLTDGKHCEVCGEVIEQQRDIPAKGHSFLDGECTVCGEADPDYVVPTPTPPVDPTPSPITNPFVDVAEKDYFYKPVLWAVQKGITGGIDTTHFAPGNPCTRGQVVTFLWRAAGSPEPRSTSHPFTDISANQYYYKAVLWAVENGITAGLTATTFAPNNACTRGQIATFLWRANGSPEPQSSNNPFSDVYAGPFYKAILWAVEEGITTGYAGGTFRPNNVCTRGNIVTFLYRAE